MNKEECKAIGGEWVQSYRKKDGTLVKSYCKSHKYVDNKKTNKNEKQKKNQQIILNQLENTIKMDDLEDARVELYSLDGVMFDSKYNYINGKYNYGDKEDEEYYKYECPEEYRILKNIPPEFKRSLQDFMNSKSVQDLKNLRFPGSSLMDKEIKNKYDDSVKKFIKKWKYK